MYPIRTPPPAAPAARAASYLLVLGQALAMLAVLWPFDASGTGSAGWLAFSLAGIALGGWALAHNRPGNFRILPEPMPHGRLVTTGPYRRVRHPMYASLLLFLLGVVLFRGGLLAAGGWIALVGVLVAKTRREEAALRARFPEYARYAARTWRLLPGVW